MDILRSTKMYYFFSYQVYLSGREKHFQHVLCGNWPEESTNKFMSSSYNPYTEGAAFSRPSLLFMNLDP